MGRSKAGGAVRLVTLAATAVGGQRAELQVIRHMALGHGYADECGERRKNRRSRGSGTRCATRRSSRRRSWLRVSLAPPDDQDHRAERDAHENRVGRRPASDLRPALPRSATLAGESHFGGQTDPLGPASSFARRRNKIMVKASAALGSPVSSAILLAPLELTIGHQERGNIIKIFLTHVFEFTTWFEAEKVDFTIGGIK